MKTNQNGKAAEPKAFTIGGSKPLVTIGAAHYAALVAAAEAAQRLHDKVWFSGQDSTFLHDLDMSLTKLAAVRAA